MIKNSLFILLFCLVQTTSSLANFYVGGTRIVYNENSKGTSIKVGNKANNRVYLVQSWVEDANEQGEAKQFIVTPPLFRLNESEENILRIIFKGQKLPADRETLFWLNIKAIPGESKNEDNKLSLAFKNKIKLFYRPQTLQKEAANAYKLIKFERTGNNLKIINPSPYYITFTSIKGNERELLKEPKMVGPFEQSAFSVSGKFSTVKWKTINDYGGTTPEQQLAM